MFGKWIRVSSSMIDMVRYDDEEEILEIAFRDGSVYRYYNVPYDIYQGLIRAPSKGRYFWRYIRDVYDYEKTY